ncbi:glycosyltransferase family 4 protein [Caminibacter sp.]
MIINATNIGQKINGIGRYSLYLSKYFLQNFNDAKIYINKNATIHFSKDELERLNIVNSSLSPDYGFRGHLKRLLWTNRFLKEPIFNTSQLEVAFFNKNQIITVHDIIPLHFKKLHKKQYHYFKYILPLALKNAKGIITVSKHTKEQLIEYYNLDESKIKVIYNGIKQVDFKKVPKKNYILYVGRASETKNIKGIIKSFCLSKKRFKIKEKLYLVGVKREDIKEDILCKDIKFLGYVSDEELEIIYQEAKVFLFPSFYEGFGYPVLEAMGYGVPVVTSKLSSLPEVVGDCAVLVNPYDIEEIAKELFKLLSDATLQEELAQKGLNRAKEFTWQKSAKAHLKVLKELL